jgi:glyceraldehyde-3-phosphate dehydrogenase (NADP+)
MSVEAIRDRDYGLLIGGHWRKAGTPAAIRNPFDGSTVATVRLADAALMDAAIAAADRAFATTRSLTTHERVRILEAIVAGLRGRADELARTIMSEAGKPITLARHEVERGINTFELAAREVHRLEGQTMPLDVSPAGRRRFGLTRRFPIGPVAAITPFNFPLNLVAHKVAPAIAVGNPIVLRPSSQTPVTALILGEVALEAGLPEGALNVVPSPVAQAEQIVADDRIKMISFTGSPAVGWPLKQKAARKKVALELGGNAAAIVALDANLDFAVPRLALGAYAYAGQICISVQRLLVHRSLYDEFVEEFAKYTLEQVLAGDPADERVICGPMITDDEANRVEQWIEEAIRNGGRQIFGGKRERNILWPSAVGNVTPAMKLNAAEAFGPVVTLASYNTFEEALEAVNNSRYGLQAGVFTRDVHRIFEAFERLEVGAVIANDYPTFRVDNMPYGGVKESGFGREGVRYTMDEMTEPRLLVLHLED